MILPELRPFATPVGDLRSLEGNPRRGDVDAVARSYERFGQRKPIVARRLDDGTGEVVAGNHQLAAARQLGWDEIAVVWVEDDDLTAKAFALADNRTADLGAYDEAALLEMVRAVSVDEGLLAASAFDADDLAKLAAAVGDESGVVEDEPPAPPDDPVSVVGDVWTLGEHRLVVGDCADADVWEKLLGDERVDCVWTDPPYGVAYKSRGREMALEQGKTHIKQHDDIANDERTGDDLEEFLRDRLGMAFAHTRAGAPWYVAAPAGREFVPFGSVLGDFGVWRQTLVWVKDQLVMGRSTFHYRHEALFYGWTPGGAHTYYGDRKQDTVWEIPRPKRSADHPTMKPVALVAKALRLSTAPNALVVDPFAGSGTTMAAAEQLGRRARLIELSPNYADVICSRFQSLSGVKPERDGQPVSFL